jgi:hypothetical protein
MSLSTSAITTDQSPSDTAPAPVIKPYRSYSSYLKERFDGRVVKITVDPGFSCPNIDGTKGRGGCTFCDETGSASRTTDKNDSIATQINLNIERMRKRFKSNRFVAYFQPHTNTYAPIETLKQVYDEAMGAHPDIMGLAVSTRPDCVTEETINLISSYQDGYQPNERYVSIEYGLQTIHNRTLALVNRCETVEDFERAYNLSKDSGIDHCIHVILGLPGESHADMMATAEQLAQWKVAGVKIHMLVAMDKTIIAKYYRQGLWQPMERAEYIETVCDFMERLHPECIIHRVAGNGHPAHVVAPLWMKQKFNVMDDIDAEFARRGTQQGSKY